MPVLCGWPATAHAVLVALVSAVLAACDFSSGQLSGPAAGTSDRAVDRSSPDRTAPIDGGPGPDSPVSADAAVAEDAGFDTRPKPTGLTACAKVAHIGDSLTCYTKAPLTAAYKAVGAGVTIDAYGGRAILQKLTADPMTGKQAALHIKSTGFKGCWVVALGTNDTANVAAGASYTRAYAIDQMMAAIDADKQARVMWVNTFTTRTSGYWSNANMSLWNKALVAAQSRWPNLRVFDWAAVAATGAAPFADGIHHTTAGYNVRNAAIAKAVAACYPSS